MCPSCETNKLCVHAQNPLGVGACIPCSLSQNRRPFAPAELPAFIATIDASDFPPPGSRPRCSDLSGSARIFFTRRRRDLLGYCSLLMSCSIRPRIPGGRIQLAFDVGYVIVCWFVETIDHLRKESFRDSTPSRIALAAPIAPRMLSCLRIKRVITSVPARLDTWPMANSYQGGIPTR